MPNCMIVPHPRPRPHARVRCVNKDVSLAVQRAAWAARDLSLLPEHTLSRVFGRTIENMQTEDFKELSIAMRKLASILSAEACKK